MVSRIKAVLAEWWQRAMPLARGFLRLSPAVRFLLGALVSAIGGSGFLGFMSEYAAYSYSLNYGFRPPLEGIPYLKATVTTLSFFLFLCAAVVFAATIFLGMTIIRFIDLSIARIRRYRRVVGGWLGFQIISDPDEMIATVRRLSLAWAATLAVLMGLFAYWLHADFADYVRMTLSAVKIEALPRVTVFLNAIADVFLDDPYFSPQGGGVVAGFTFFAVLLAWKPNSAPIFAFSVTVLLFVIAPFALFHAPTYGKALRALGYGGGIPAIITTVATQDVEAKVHAGYILLRTTEAVILLDSAREFVVELPSQHVRSIQIPAGQEKRKYNLPEAAAAW